MGSGSRFKISYSPFIGLGVSWNTFPHAFCLNILMPFIYIYIGFGKGYDE